MQDIVHTLDSNQPVDLKIYFSLVLPMNPFTWICLNVPINDSLEMIILLKWVLKGSQHKTFHPTSKSTSAKMHVSSRALVDDKYFFRSILSNPY